MSAPARRSGRRPACPRRAVSVSRPTSPVRVGVQRRGRRPPHVRRSRRGSCRPARPSRHRAWSSRRSRGRSDPRRATVVGRPGHRACRPEPCRGRRSAARPAWRAGPAWVRSSRPPGSPIPPWAQRIRLRDSPTTCRPRVPSSSCFGRRARRCCRPARSANVRAAPIVGRPHADRSIWSPRRPDVAQNRNVARRGCPPCSPRSGWCRWWRR